MKLTAWDPDLKTLLGRIESEELNLQPDFQRGEVWGNPKKRRLIDSVLREWHIPPIHVVVDPFSERQEVLDGQQRLVAIRDFANGELTVDGTCPPLDEEIASLNGLTYSQLPERFRRRFDNFSLRVIRVTDFDAQEPGELFFRLNQPSSLTAAEQRNAFFGEARAQVRTLVRQFTEFGIDEEVLGFKNSRMAYDDVVAKVCFAHDVGNLRTKITAGVVTAMYRGGEPFRQATMSRVRNALELFGAASSRSRGLKFNKATLFSWLLFISVLQRGSDRQDPSHIGKFMRAFETTRQEIRNAFFLFRDETENDPFPGIAPQDQQKLLALFNDRSASRVADVSSVLIRDYVLWAFYIASSPPPAIAHNALGDAAVTLLETTLRTLREGSEDALESMLETSVESAKWGSRL